MENYKLQFCFIIFLVVSFSNISDKYSNIFSKLSRLKKIKSKKVGLKVYMRRGFENFFSTLEIPVTAATIILRKSIKVFSIVYPQGIKIFRFSL